MNKILGLILIVCFLLLNSCGKPFNDVLLNPVGLPFPEKLPSLEVVANYNSDVVDYFNREVNEIMTYPNEDKKGYIELNITENKSKYTKIGYFVLARIMIFIPCLFGMPLGGYKYELEVKIDILDSEKNILGTYRNIAEYEEVVGLFHDHYDDIYRVAYLRAVKRGIQMAKVDIKNDIGRLRMGLR